jgi:hypothetical protein
MTPRAVRANVFKTKSRPVLANCNDVLIQRLVAAPAIVHAATGLFRLPHDHGILPAAQPAGVRGVVAEFLLVKHELSS